MPKVDSKPATTPSAPDAGQRQVSLHQVAELNSGISLPAKSQPLTFLNLQPYMMPP